MCFVQRVPRSMLGSAPDGVRCDVLGENSAETIKITSLFFFPLIEYRICSANHASTLFTACLTNKNHKFLPGQLRFLFHRKLFPKLLSQATTESTRKCYFKKLFFLNNKKKVVVSSTT